MAYQSLTVSNAWPASPQFTAASDTDVALVNPNTGDGATLFWVTTPDDTQPTITPEEAMPVPPRDSGSFQLLSGERLWIAAPGLSNGPVKATLLS